jgi:hypothetical protein
VDPSGLWWPWDEHHVVSPATQLHFLLLFKRIPFFYMLLVEEKTLPDLISW